MTTSFAQGGGGDGGGSDGVGGGAEAQPTYSEMMNVAWSLYLQMMNEKLTDERKRLKQVFIEYADKLDVAHHVNSKLLIQKRHDFQVVTEELREIGDQYQLSSLNRALDSIKTVTLAVLNGLDLEQPAALRSMLGKAGDGKTGSGFAVMKALKRFEELFEGRFSADVERWLMGEGEKSLKIPFDPELEQKGYNPEEGPPTKIVVRIIDEIQDSLTMKYFFEYLESEKALEDLKNQRRDVQRGSRSSIESYLKVLLDDIEELSREKTQSSHSEAVRLSLDRLEAILDIIGAGIPGIIGGESSEFKLELAKVVGKMRDLETEQNTSISTLKLTILGLQKQLLDMTDRTEEKDLIEKIQIAQDIFDDRKIEFDNIIRMHYFWWAIFGDGVHDSSVRRGEKTVKAPLEYFEFIKSVLYDLQAAQKSIEEAEAWRDKLKEDLTAAEDKVKRVGEECKVQQQTYIKHKADIKRIEDTIVDLQKESDLQLAFAMSSDEKKPADLDAAEKRVKEIDDEIKKLREEKSSATAGGAIIEAEFEESKRARTEAKEEAKKCRESLAEQELSVKRAILDFNGYTIESKYTVKATGEDGSETFIRMIEGMFRDVPGIKDKVEEMIKAQTPDQTRTITIESLEAVSSKPKMFGMLLFKELKEWAQNNSSAEYKDTQGIKVNSAMRMWLDLTTSEITSNRLYFGNHVYIVIGNLIPIMNRIQEVAEAEELDIRDAATMRAVWDRVATDEAVDKATKELFDVAFGFCAVMDKLAENAATQKYYEQWKTYAEKRGNQTNMEAINSRVSVDASVEVLKPKSEEEWATTLNTILGRGVRNSTRSLVGPLGLTVSDVEIDSSVIKYMQKNRYVNGVAGNRGVVGLLNPLSITLSMELQNIIVEKAFSSNKPLGELQIELKMKDASSGTSSELVTILCDGEGNEIGKIERNISISIDVLESTDDMHRKLVRDHQRKISRQDNSRMMAAFLISGMYYFRSRPNSPFLGSVNLWEQNKESKFLQDRASVIIQLIAEHIIMVAGNPGTAESEWASLVKTNSIKIKSHIRALVKSILEAEEASDIARNVKPEHKLLKVIELARGSRDAKRNPDIDFITELVFKEIANELTTFVFQTNSHLYNLIVEDLLKATDATKRVSSEMVKGYVESLQGISSKVRDEIMEASPGTVAVMFPFLEYVPHPLKALFIRIGKYTGINFALEKAGFINKPVDLATIKRVQAARKKADLKKGNATLPPPPDSMPNPLLGAGGKCAALFAR